MLFVSLKFLGFFLVAFLVYWAIPGQRRRMLWLLAASAYFYMSWNPWLILLILFSASIDYFAALAIEASTDARVRRALLVGSIAINLGLLCYFKYVNFFLDNLFALGNWFGWSGDRRALEILLPLGISFYTFETVSYIVDVFRGKVKAERDWLSYALFILFFPHLIAGPIVRAGDFLPQTKRRKRLSWNRFDLGARLFLLGFIKKAVIADFLATIPDPVFADPGQHSSLTCLIAVLAYAGQVYGDFSGYSDMAIGLAHMFGYKLHANFDRPFLATNVADIWRRWHISLSTWLRDYVFIPLGGSRGSAWATYRNLLATMMIGGLWHGATWPWMLWGGFNGVALIVHRAASPILGRVKIPRMAAIAMTFASFCVGLIIFRTENIVQTVTMLARIASPIVGLPFAGASLDPELGTLALLGFAAVILEQVMIGWQPIWRPAKRSAFASPAVGAALGVLVAIAVLCVPQIGSTFIYFNF